MRQSARVLRAGRPGYVEVTVCRGAACSHARVCGSCEHCGLLEGASEIVVEARNDVGAQVGDTVILETDTRSVLGVAAVLYLVPFALFLALSLFGSAIGCSERVAAALGCGGFALGLFGAYILERDRRKHPIRFQVAAIKR